MRVAHRQSDARAKPSSPAHGSSSLSAPGVTRRSDCGSLRSRWSTWASLATMPAGADRVVGKRPAAPAVGLGRLLGQADGEPACRRAPQHVAQVVTPAPCRAGRAARPRRPGGTGPTASGWRSGARAAGGPASSSARPCRTGGRGGSAATAARGLPWPRLVCSSALTTGRAGAAGSGREALVGDVTHHRVPEPQHRVGVADQELAEPRVGVSSAGARVRAERGEVVGVEPHAEHRSVPQHDAVGRRQPVDLARSPAPAPSAAGRSTEPAWSAAWTRDSRNNGLPSASPRGPPGSVAAAAAPRWRPEAAGTDSSSLERREPQRAHRDVGPAQPTGSRSRRAVTNSHGSVGEPLRQVGEEVRRRAVHEVRVVHQDHRRRGQQQVQELGDDLLDASLAELVAEAPVRSFSGIARSRGTPSSGSHGEQVRGVVPDPSVEPVAGGLLVGSRPDADQVAEQHPERVVRRRRLELVARHRQDRQVVGHRPDLVDQPRLADARLADDVDVAAVAARASCTAAASRRPRRPGPPTGPRRGSRPRPCGRPARRRRHGPDGPCP